VNFLRECVLARSAPILACPVVVGSGLAAFADDTLFLDIFYLAGSVFNGLGTLQIERRATAASFGSASFRGTMGAWQKQLCRCQYAVSRAQCRE